MDAKAQRLQRSARRFAEKHTPPVGTIDPTLLGGGDTPVDYDEDDDCPTDDLYSPPVKPTSSSLAARSTRSAPAQTTPDESLTKIRRSKTTSRGRGRGKPRAKAVRGATKKSKPGSFVADDDEEEEEEEEVVKVTKRKRKKAVAVEDVEDEELGGQNTSNNNNNRGNDNHSAQQQHYTGFLPRNTDARSGSAELYLPFTTPSCSSTPNNGNNSSMSTPSQEHPNNNPLLASPPTPFLPPTLTTLTATTHPNILSILSASNLNYNLKILTLGQKCHPSLYSALQFGFDAAAVPPEMLPTMLLTFEELDFAYSRVYESYYTAMEAAKRVGDAEVERECYQKGFVVKAQWDSVARARDELSRLICA